MSSRAPWPSHGGFALRAARLLDVLTLEWDVCLVTGRFPDQPDPAPDRGTELEVIAVEIPPPLLVVPARATVARFSEVVDRALARHRPDVLLSWPGTESVTFDRPDLPPLVADRVDCAVLERIRALPRSPGTLTRLARTALYERRMLRTAAVTVAAGPADARMFGRLARGRRIEIVPNGIEADSSCQLDLLAPAPTVAFTGTLDYPPNVHTARVVVRELWPTIRRLVPSARLVIAGRRPARSVRALATVDGVEVRAGVPDMADVLRSAWVAVAPMRRGAGIKNKVLEAWAVGRPVVMTEIAANGLDLGPEASELVTNRSADLAARVARLLLEPAYHRIQSEAALRQAERHPSWRDSGRAISALLSEVGRPIE